MSYHDPLTGLISKTGFVQQLQQLLAASHPGQVHGLLYLDLDRFKLVNDTCGQVAGDELLRQLAGIMGGHLRASDVLARLGGDEFAVLLAHCDIPHAVNIAELLLQAIDDFSFSWQGRSFQISTSVGLVCLDGGITDVAQLLSQADLACYMAKQQGRNRVHVFDQQDLHGASSRESMAWASRIRHALDDNRLLLYAQQILPITATDTSRQFELLVRMMDAQGQVIQPGSFLGAAERYNLMPAVDRWVVNEALQGLAGAARQTGTEAGRCFINLSASAFGDTAFIAYLVERLEHTGIAADQICFEMPETMTMNHLQSAVMFIRRIRDLGCHFALNRFGSGLHSFSYLKTLPVDYLKIDGALVRHVVEDGMDRAIVEAIHRIARVAGAKTVAEYVENAEIYRVIQELGLDFAQGTYMDEPMPWPG